MQRMLDFAFNFSVLGYEMDMESFVKEHFVEKTKV